MIVLALDSRSVRGSAALWRDGRTLEVRASQQDRSFSSQLPALLLDLVAACGHSIADVDVFAACTGPGSLTGLRVGLSTVQGLAFASRRPVVAVSALEAAAVDAAQHAPSPPGNPAWVGAWLDAFRGEVFTARYRLDPMAGAWKTRLAEVEAPAVGSPGDAATRWATATAGTRGIVGGDAVGRSALAPLLAGRVAFHEIGLLAGAVAALAAERAGRGDVTSPHALHPLYVRRPDAEVARDRRLGTARGTAV